MSSSYTYLINFFLKKQQIKVRIKLIQKIMREKNFDKERKEPFLPFLLYPLSLTQIFER